MGNESTPALGLSLMRFRSLGFINRAGSRCAPHALKGIEKMPSISIGNTNDHNEQGKKRKSGHTKPKAPQISLHEPGWIRVAHFQALLGDLSHSAFYARLKLGRVPKPDGHDPRPYWRTETVRAFLGV